MKRPIIFWQMVIGLVSTDAMSMDQEDPRIQEALWQGLNYMIQSAADPGNFKNYASDYLFFFADVQRIEDPWIESVAREEGLRLGEIYLRNHFHLDSADEVLDATSALCALESLGMNVDVPLALVRDSAKKFSVADYLWFDPSKGESPDLDGLIDLLIGFHFTERMNVAVGVSYAESLMYAPSVVYFSQEDLGSARYVEQNNLVTHLVYTLTDYGDHTLSPALLPRETRYLREQLPAALMWADPETVSEFIDSLKLLGVDSEDIEVSWGMELLLSMQKEDGHWEPQEPEDEYDRYHATWCAMDALRGYDNLKEGLEDFLILSLLRRWAEQWTRGDRPDPVLEIGPDLDSDESE